MVSVLTVLSTNSADITCVRLLARLTQRLSSVLSVVICAVATASIAAVAGFFCSVSILLPAPTLQLDPAAAAVTVAEVVMVDRMSIPQTHCTLSVRFRELQLGIQVMQVGRRGQFLVGADDFQEAAHVLPRLRLNLPVLRQVRPAKQLQRVRVIHHIGI